MYLSKAEYVSQSKFACCTCKSCPIVGELASSPMEGKRDIKYTQSYLDILIYSGSGSTMYILSGLLCDCPCVRRAMAHFTLLLVIRNCHGLWVLFSPFLQFIPYWCMMGLMGERAAIQFFKMLTNYSLFFNKLTNYSLPLNKLINYSLPLNKLINYSLPLNKLTNYSLFFNKLTFYSVFFKMLTLHSQCHAIILMWIFK